MVIKRSRIAIACLILMLASFYLSSVSNAENWGWKWGSSHLTTTGVLALGYYNGDTTSNYNTTTVLNGANKWNFATGSRFGFYATSHSVSSVDILGATSSTFTNNGWGTDTRAWTQVYKGTTACDSSPYSDMSCGAGDTITYAAIYINDGNAYSSATYREALIAHELGHSGGLRHQSYLSGTIMSSDLSLGTDVTAYDVSQTAVLYP